MQRIIFGPLHHNVTPVIIISNGKVINLSKDRFGNRPCLHEETGSISKLSINDSGIFRDQLKTGTQVLNLTFIFTVTIAVCHTLPKKKLDGSK